MPKVNNKTILDFFRLGSPLLLFDETHPERPLMAVCVLLGQVHDKPEDLVTHPDLIDKLGYKDCTELIVRVLACDVTPIPWFKVASNTEYSRFDSYGNVHSLVTFDNNWAVTNKPKKQSPINVATHLPHIPSNLFSNIGDNMSMSKISKVLAPDFQERLADLKKTADRTKDNKQGRRSEAAGNELFEKWSKEPWMWLTWRRASLFKMALTLGDRFGYAFQAFEGVLPGCLLPTPIVRATHFPFSAFVCRPLPDIEDAAISEVLLPDWPTTTTKASTRRGRGKRARSDVECDDTGSGSETE